MDIFNFTDYRDILKAKIKENQQTRGYQTILSKAAGCQRAYLSQVLNSHINLTFDHAAGITKYWQLEEAETDYFMELLALARASTPVLKRIIERKLLTLKKTRQNLSERFKTSISLPEEVQANYYSSWHFIAVHVLLSIPEYSDAAKISKRLGLAVHMVERTIKTLEKLKLIKKDGKGWSVSQSNLFLPKMSNFTGMNHISWRQRGILNIQAQDDDALHYTVVSALSLKDIEMFRDTILACIDKTRKIVEPSPEEEMVCFTCDFFKV